MYVLGDDNHESVYKANFLVQFDYNTWVSKKKYKRKLWHGNEIEKKIAKIPHSDFFHSANGARAVFQSILDYGVALIENVSLA